MKQIFLLVTALAIVSTNAQTFIPMKKGTVLEYKYYNAKGKPLRNELRDERWLRFTVEEVWSDSLANIAIENETFERILGMKAGRPLYPAINGMNYGDVKITEEGVTFENMQWIFPPIPAPMINYMDEEEETSWGMELNATQFLPADIKVGDQLPEERYNAVFRHILTDEQSKEIAERLERENEIASNSLGGISLPKTPVSLDWQMSGVMRNRSVEASEKVTTPAGEWECWKISYDVVGPTVRGLGWPTRTELLAAGVPAEWLGQMFNETVPVTTHYIDYLSPEIGLVKREKMNFRGNNVEETMVLESIK